MPETTEITQLIRKATTCSRALGATFPNISSEKSLFVNPSDPYIKCFINTVYEIVTVKSYPPIQKFYAVYLLLKASELQGADSLMTQLAQSELLTDLFRIAQTDLTNEVSLRGANYFSKTGDKGLRQLGINFVRLCYETLIYFGTKYGTPDVNNPRHIYHFLSTTIKKKGKQPFRHYFVKKQYNLNLCYDLATWNFKDHDPPLENECDPNFKNIKPDDVDNEDSPNNSKKEEIPEIARRMTKLFSFNPIHPDNLARANIQQNENNTPQKEKILQPLIINTFVEKEMISSPGPENKNQEQRKESASSPYFKQARNSLKVLEPHDENFSNFVDQMENIDFSKKMNEETVSIATENKEKAKPLPLSINLARVNKYKLAVFGPSEDGKGEKEIKNEHAHNKRMNELEKDLLKIQESVATSKQRMLNSPSSRGNTSNAKIDLSGIVSPRIRKEENGELSNKQTTTETPRDLDSARSRDEGDNKSSFHLGSKVKSEGIKGKATSPTITTTSRVDKYKMMILGPAEPEREVIQSNTVSQKKFNDLEKDLLEIRASIERNKVHGSMQSINSSFAKSDQAVSPLNAKMGIEEMQKTNINSKDQERSRFFGSNECEGNKQKQICPQNLNEELSRTKKQSKTFALGEGEALKIRTRDNRNHTAPSPGMISKAKQCLTIETGKVQSLGHFDTEEKKFGAESKSTPNEFITIGEQRKWNSVTFVDEKHRNKYDPFSKSPVPRISDPKKKLGAIIEEVKIERKQKSEANTPTMREEDLKLKNVKEYEDKIKRLEREVEELKKGASRTTIDSLQNLEEIEDSNSKSNNKVIGQSKNSYERRGYVN